MMDLSWIFRAIDLSMCLYRINLLPYSKEMLNFDLKALS